MKRVYFSDVHIGKNMKPSEPRNCVWLDKSGKKGEFKNFLDYLKTSDAGEIVMVGDVMDDWVCPIDVVPPTFDDILGDPANGGVVASLRALSDAKEVIYLRGNHDMSVGKATITDFFPRMTFGGNHEYGFQYIEENFAAEHGTSSAMFNGPDYIHDKATYLPLGYFITRVLSTKYINDGEEIQWYDIVKGLLAHMGRRVVGEKFVRGVFRTVYESAGLDEQTKILIRPNEYLDPGRRGYITIEEIMDLYADTWGRWKGQKRFLKDAVSAANVDTGNVGLMVLPLNKEHETDVVILGHTHDQLHDYYQDNLPDIYANSGCWCHGSGPYLHGSGFFVETESAGGRVVKVRLKYWDDASKKAVDSGNAVVCPRPQDPLGRYVGSEALTG